jgi:nitrogen fixation/metabolism regulation signal transduction histidine kinase
VGTCQDITDLKRAQAETAGRQKLESVGTLASGIAHDFDNLLGAVLAQAEVALQELADGSNPQDELKAIRNVALRGSEIVRELMVYAGKEAAVVELVDMSRIVKDMLELLKVSVSKHAGLEHDLAEDLPSVSANAAQLRQIVLNLVTNASDAIGHTEGIIRVTTRCLKVGIYSTPDHLPASDYVELEVSDTGCGIVTGNAEQGVRSVLLDQIGGTRSGARGGPKDSPKSQWNHQSDKPARQGHYISNITALHGSHRWGEGRCDSCRRGVGSPDSIWDRSGCGRRESVAPSRRENAP